MSLQMFQNPTNASEIDYIHFCECRVESDSQSPLFQACRMPTIHTFFKVWIMDGRGRLEWGEEKHYLSDIALRRSFLNNFSGLNEEFNTYIRRWPAPVKPSLQPEPIPSSPTSLPPSWMNVDSLHSANVCTWKKLIKINVKCSYQTFSGRLLQIGTLESFLPTHGWSGIIYTDCHFH